MALGTKQKVEELNNGGLTPTNKSYTDFLNKYLASNPDHGFSEEKIRDLAAEAWIQEVSIQDIIDNKLPRHKSSIQDIIDSKQVVAPAAKDRVLITTYIASNPNHGYTQAELNEFADEATCFGVSIQDVIDGVF